MKLFSALSCLVPLFAPHVLSPTPATAQQIIQKAATVAPAVAGLPEAAPFLYTLFEHLAGNTTAEDTAKQLLLHYLGVAEAIATPAPAAVPA